MTIRDQLLFDKILNKETAIAIAKKACASSKIFTELMACFLSDEYRLAQRAAWSVSHAAKLKPAAILPYIKDMTAQLLRTDVHDAVIRNSTRILKGISVPEEYHGEVMNACFILAGKADTPIAIKAFSLTMLHKLSRLYPDIKQELDLIAISHLENDSAAVRSVAKKIVNMA